MEPTTDEWRGTEWLGGVWIGDRLDGGKGDDTLRGGKGDDRLYGGKGSDTFVFDTSKAHGDDFIGDFETNDGDRIRFDGDITFEDLTITDGGPLIYKGIEYEYCPTTVVISYGDDTITLVGLSGAADLTEEDFIFG